MKMIPYDVGRVVLSKQGHDKGRLFLIVGLVDEKHVLIADGETRKIAKPKKKQMTHLRALPTTASEALSEQEQRANTADSTIRKALAAAAVVHNSGSSRAARITNKEEYALVQE